MDGLDITAKDLFATFGSGRAVSIALQKGGAGKTAFAINLSERFANRGLDVCLFDMDAQGTATMGVGCKDVFYTDDRHFGRVIEDDGPPPESLLQETDFGFDLIPATHEQRQAKVLMDSIRFGFSRIKQRIVDPLLEERYDLIILDAPPSLDSLSDAALYASHGVIVPILMSDEYVSGFHRFNETQLKDLREVVDIGLIAVVPNKCSTDTEERRIIRDLEEAPAMDGKLPPFVSTAEYDKPGSPGPGMRQHIAIRKAYGEREPLAEFDPDSEMLPRFDALADMTLEYFARQAGVVSE